MNFARTAPVVAALRAPATTPLAATTPTAPALAIAGAARAAPAAPPANAGPAGPAAPAISPATPVAPTAAAAPARPRVGTHESCGHATANTQSQGDAYVLVHGEGEVMHGTPDDLHTARRYAGDGRRVLWFRADGKQYLVRDPTLLHQLAVAYLRSQQLADAQARLAARQQALSERQAALAAQLSAHAEPRLLQASTRTASATTSTAAQPPATPDALQALARQQQALAQRQAVLASKQAGASRLATQQALKVLREALRSGLAMRIDG
ncbi:hypothetical protein MOU_05059 [Xanthomonas citri pv. malvacearum str. GSPB1386]|nr:hypothetical protein MOU_05059 [Xanthomonas citri pv. malvacearum str. GSPB1386]